MIDLPHYALTMTARAEWVILLLLGGFLVGEWLGRIDGFEKLLGRGNRLAQALAHKLDRSKRGTATLVYRGMIAVAMLLVPAFIAGRLLSDPNFWAQILGIALLVMWFGHAFGVQSGWRLWRRAIADTTPLELAGSNYLFPDTHAVLRYAIATRAELFAVGVVGASFWYVLTGWPMLLVYLTLHAATAHFRGPAFGWAARSMFTLFDILPRLIARALFAVAALFTPEANPFALFLAGEWRLYVARLLAITLGGPSPEGETLWIGEGTAKLTPQHLRRFLVLEIAAGILWVLILAAPTIYKMLIKLI